MLEDRCLLSGISGITEFAVSGTSTSTTGITPGPDGNLWFVDRGADAIGVINHTTHAISYFSISTPQSAPWGITAGPDGNLWFTDGGAQAVGVINPSTHAMSEFSLPTGYAHPDAITMGPDGNLWFTRTFGIVTPNNNRAIEMINPTTHAISNFPVNNADGPFGITAGPEGNIWFTLGEEVGEINLATDAITYFPGGDSPNSITTGPDGNLWFTDGNINSIGVVNPSTGALSEFPFPTGSPGGSITSGPDGNLWFTAGGQIGQINPTTHAITEYPIPYTGASAQGIAVGPDGNLWFVDSGTNAIGVATLTTSQLVVTTEPPSSVTAGSGFGLTVTAEDSSGNLITSFNGTVTIALATNPGGATLGGTLSVTASSGVATFSGLTLNKAASGYTLYASGGGYGWGVTSAITVSPAAATQLVITQQPPATVKVNTGFGFQASIEDQYGNVVSAAANTVKVAFANNPTGAFLGGTLSVNASQGVATFSGLTINKTGNGYTVQVSSSGLTSATTSAINVTKTGKASIVAGTVGTTAPDPLLAPLVLDSPDLWDGLGFKKHAHRM
jgi:streptogramin lyase